jgi:chemotaxis protein MotA
LDLATLIGLIAGTTVVIGGILVDSSIGAFINVPSVLIVLGGTFGAVLIKFPMTMFLGAFRVMFKAFIHRLDTPTEIIAKAVELSALVRKEGLLALENQEVSNRFLKKGLRLCADGLEPNFVRKVLNTEMMRGIERHEQGESIFRAIGESAPAFGMIGTLIGLVQMLTTMDDPKSIGPAMAVALLTTLYGALIANLFALPVAEKLSLRSQEERVLQTLIIESIAQIQESRNPRVVEELLRTYLPTGRQLALEADGRRGADAGAEAGGEAGATENAET